MDPLFFYGHPLYRHCNMWYIMFLLGDRKVEDIKGVTRDHITPLDEPAHYRFFSYRNTHFVLYGFCPLKRPDSLPVTYDYIFYSGGQFYYIEDGPALRNFLFKLKTRHFFKVLTKEEKEKEKAEPHPETIQHQLRKPSSNSGKTLLYLLGLAERSKALD